jgi:hypothetical protein
MGFPLLIRCCWFRRLQCSQHLHIFVVNLLNLSFAGREVERARCPRRSHKLTLLAHLLHLILTVRAELALIEL